MNTKRSQKSKSIANLRNFKTFFQKKFLTASRMTHRVNVEKVVEQAQPQSVGIAGKASSVHLWKRCKMQQRDHLNLFHKKDQDVEEYSNFDGHEAAVPRVFTRQQFLNPFPWHWLNQGKMVMLILNDIECKQRFGWQWTVMFALGVGTSKEACQWSLYQMVLLSPQHLFKY